MSCHVLSTTALPGKMVSWQDPLVRETNEAMEEDEWTEHSPLCCGILRNTQVQMTCDSAV